MRNDAIFFRSYFKSITLNFERKILPPLITQILQPLKNTTGSRRPRCVLYETAQGNKHAKVGPASVLSPIIYYTTITSIFLSEKNISNLDLSMNPNERFIDNLIIF